MSKILNLGFKVSKIWAIIWYALIPISIYSALINETFGIYDLIFYSFIMATIGALPLSIIRHFKLQKQKETRNAIQ